MNLKDFQGLLNNPKNIKKAVKNKEISINTTGVSIGRERYNLLQYAVKEGYGINILKEILDAGAEVDATHTGREIIPLIAERDDYLEVVKLFMKYKFDINRKIPHKNKNIKPELGIISYIFDEYEYSISENFKRIEPLLKLGADINVSTIDNGNIMYPFISKKKYLPYFKKLLKYGASVRISTNHRPSVIDKAVLDKKTHIDFLKAILDDYGKGNISEEHQYSTSEIPLLIRAIIRGKYKRAKMLLEYGFNPSLKTDVQSGNAFIVILETLSQFEDITPPEESLELARAIIDSNIDFNDIPSRIDSLMEIIPESEAGIEVLEYMIEKGFTPTNEDIEVLSDRDNPIFTDAIKKILLGL